MEPAGMPGKAAAARPRYMGVPHPESCGSGAPGPNRRIRTHCRPWFPTTAMTAHAPFRTFAPTASDGTVGVGPGSSTAVAPMAGWHSVASVPSRCNAGASSLAIGRRPIWHISQDDPVHSAAPFVSPGDLIHPGVRSRALLRPPRLRGVGLPVALFDAAGPLVPGNGGADMVGASPLTCSGNFLLRLAACQGKDLIAEARRAAPVAGWLRGRSTRAPA
jgi:hypothetical protein